MELDNKKDIGVMKQLEGIPHNINEIIIGKVAIKIGLFTFKKDLILITTNSKLPKGYKALITSFHHKDIKSECVVDNVGNISELHDNDIITIYPDGKINIIYDSNSHHNAVFITERCNSNCIMCPQPPVKQEEDKFDLNLKFISLIDKKTKSIGITGGEPTLIGEKLFDILRAIYHRIPDASINLLSNGVKFENYQYAKKFTQAIKQEIIVDIPLYSDIDTIHNSIVRTNSFYRTIKGIYNLAKFNMKIGIRVVIHRMNYERLPELAEFIYSNFPFVYHVAFMQMEPIGYAKDNLNDLWIDPLDYTNELEKAIINLRNRDIHVSIYNTQLCILPEKLKRYAVQSITDWKNIYLAECEKCILKEKCPGFFMSSKEIHSRGISAIKDLQAINAC